MAPSLESEALGQRAAAGGAEIPPRFAGKWTLAAHSTITVPTLTADCREEIFPAGEISLFAFRAEFTRRNIAIRFAMNAEQASAAAERPHGPKPR